MFRILNTYSKSRKCWILLTSTVIILELTALYFQYIFLLKPCVLCIYQRCALCAIGVAGVVGTIAPDIALLRLFAICIWIYSAWEGLLLAKKHTNIQLHPSPFFTCDLFVKFPNYLPLDQWWPAIFNAYGNCSEYQWYFLSLEMSQWMLIIFSSYLLIALFILLSQFIKTYHTK